MNGVPEYYEVKMKQTSKGIWYCDGFTASMEDPEDAIRVADIAMSRIETVLKAHNITEGPVEENLWKKAGDKIMAEKRAKQPVKKEEK